MTPQRSSCESAPARYFATTHWSVVLAAGEGDSEAALEALSRLCQTYWYPLYAYVRSRGISPEDAEDLTQSFFGRILEKNSLARAEPAKGKFRFYLLGALKNFLCDAYDKASALKRGGGQKPVSFDAQTAEARFRLEPLDPMSPEKIYERRWGLTLLDQALSRLKAEYSASGKERLYEALEEFLVPGAQTASYADVAARLGLSESAIKSALHRLRRRQRELIREEIGRTVSNEAEVEDEIRYLIRVMADS